MTPHSSTLAWKIPWTEEPGRLQSMGSLRVGVPGAHILIMQMRRSSVVFRKGGITHLGGRDVREVLVGTGPGGVDT